jgi:hypothetical protein
VEAILETLLPEDENEFDTKPGISSRMVVTSADGEAERLRWPWPRARIRPDEALDGRGNSETLSRVISMLDCEFIDSQSDVGGVSSAAGVRTIVVGRERSSLELRLSAKILRCKDGAMGLFTNAMAARSTVNGLKNGGEVSK